MWLSSFLEKDRLFMTPAIHPLSIGCSWRARSSWDNRYPSLSLSGNGFPLVKARTNGDRILDICNFVFDVEPDPYDARASEAQLGASVCLQAFVAIARRPSSRILYNQKLCELV